jgi:hypothetical protein
MTKAIVTRESVKAMLNHDDKAYVERVIGRALVVLFERQTADEQVSNETSHQNAIGFTGADAKSGTLTAKYFLKHRRLEQWMIDRWTKEDKNGSPRLAKYHRQLNEAAVARAARS